MLINHSQSIKDNVDVKAYRMLFYSYNYYVRQHIYIQLEDKIHEQSWSNGRLIWSILRNNTYEKYN